MQGYDENFLPEHIALPRFSIGMESRVLKQDGLRDGMYRDYIHYTVAMHRDRRSPFFAALNIDQKLVKSVTRSDWDTDDSIGPENQLDNDYYYKNRWDKGHLAMRANAAWGETSREARYASDATMFYSNAALQFSSFNRTEWKALEEWVQTRVDTDSHKITVFTGPIYGEDSVFVAPGDLKPAAVPAAFFKIICLINKQGKLDVRAFLGPQDRDAFADWQDTGPVNHQLYQTTVAEIEQRTGLMFDEKVADTNPLYFHPTDERIKKLKIAPNGFPENIPIDRPADLVGRTADGADIPRDVLADSDESVFIVGALPNPTGGDRGREWVSILNLKDTTVDIAGWVLEDRSGRKTTLSGSLEPGEAIRVQGQNLGSIQLGNNGDILTLWDGAGQQRRRIDRVRYEKRHVQEGKAIIFPRAHQDATDED